MATQRLRAANADDGEEAKMDMSPMIDMVFLLLLFFLVVSNPKTIKIDPRLKPPIADAAKTAKSKHGKIVVNIHNSGDFYAEDTITRFDTKEDLIDYIKKEKDIIDGRGITPVLHIRGDSTAEFKFCRQVIRSGAAAGVNQVAFGAFKKE